MHLLVFMVPTIPYKDVWSIDWKSEFSNRIRQKKFSTELRPVSVEVGRSRQSQQ